MSAVCSVVGGNYFEVSVATTGGGGGGDEGAIVRAGWSRSGWEVPEARSALDSAMDSKKVMDCRLRSRNSVTSCRSSAIIEGCCARRRWPGSGEGSLGGWEGRRWAGRTLSRDLARKRSFDSHLSRPQKFQQCLKIGAEQIQVADLVDF
jgi:hypothetical protein